MTAVLPPAASSLLAGSAPRPARGILARVARRPVTAALLVMFGVGWPLMIPAVLAGLPIEPFLLATVLLGQLGGSVLVAAATGGRPGVRDLFARVFRWRASPWLWLVAVVGMPLASLAVTSAWFGTGAVRAVLGDPRIAVAWLGALSILPLVNLWEEASWAGTIQHRLTDRYGLLRGAAITGPAFALVHLPLQLGRPMPDLVWGMVAIAALSVPFRLVIGWLYERSGHSVLLVATFHAAFNATNNGPLLRAAAPDRALLVSTMPWLVVVLGALAVLAAGRGRRSADPAGADPAGADPAGADPRGADTTGR